MNKKKALYGMIFAVVIFLAAVAVCIGSREKYGKAEEKSSIRIGVSLYRSDDTFISSLCQELERVAKSCEQESGTKIILDVADARGNQNTQDGQVERFISLGCDVLCINIVDRSAASNIIDKAIAADTPVVFFNREPVEEDMNRWEKLYYVGADAKESAILQGNIVVDAYNEAPQNLDLNGDGVVSYVLLEGETSHQDSLIRTEWSIQTLKNGGISLKKITGGIANWERSQASALMEQWLINYPGEIELVICNNDDMALGAIDAIERLEIKAPVKTVGIDGTPAGIEALEKGKLFGTVKCDIELYAKTIFDISSAMAFERDVTIGDGIDGGKYYRCPQKALMSEILN